MPSKGSGISLYGLFLLYYQPDINVTLLPGLIEIEIIYHFLYLPRDVKNLGNITNNWQYSIKIPFFYFTKVFCIMGN